MGIIKKLAMAAVLISFTAAGYAQKVNSIEGHEYVDLGLSVNWATCNVGSKSPEELGDYYAWGETYSKSCYNKMTYKFSGGKEGLGGLLDYTKYLGDENKFEEDDSKLDITDDVANVQWGGKWRMPTKNEIKELIDSCDWKFDELNGVKGCWAISKVNGNKVFFPLAGYIYDDVVDNVGKSGKYWSSELRKDMCFEAYQLWISYDDNLAEMQGKSSIYFSDDGYREYGRSVRAVYCK